MRSPDDLAADVVAQEAWRAPDVVALAELCSLAARVEPFLVRRLRYQVLTSATTATEADLWSSRLVEATSREGLAFDPACARELRRRVATSPLLESAIGCIRLAHAGAPPSLRLEEELVHLGVRQTVDERAVDERLASIAKAFVDSPHRSDAIALWVSRFLPRLPATVTALPGARALQLWAAERLGGTGGAGVEEGADLGEWRSILGDATGPGEVVGVRLLPSGVELSWPPGQPAHELDSGPPPVTLEVDLPDGAGGFTLRPRRGEPATVGLTLFAMIGFPGSSWLDDREVIQLAGHPAATVVAALDVDGGVTTWDVGTRRRRRLDVAGAEAVAVAAADGDGDVTVLVASPGAVSGFDGEGLMRWRQDVPAGRFASLAAGGRGPRWAAVVDGRLVGRGQSEEDQWVDEGTDYLSAVVADDGTVLTLTATTLDRRSSSGGLLDRRDGSAVLAISLLDGHRLAVLSNRPDGETVSLVDWDPAGDVVVADRLVPGTRLVMGGAVPAWVTAAGAFGTGVGRDEPQSSPIAQRVRRATGAVVTGGGTLVAGPADRIEVRTRRGQRQLIEALPATLLGAWPEAAGTSFRVTAPDAELVELCLVDVSGEERRRPMQRDAGGEWWVRVPGVGAGQRYGFRVTGPSLDPGRLLLDPYARAVQLGAASTQPDALLSPLGVVVNDRFDWRDDRRPNTAWDRTVLYEVDIRDATMLHPDVPPAMRGTYAGFAHPSFLAHLVELGVSAVVLTPVQAFLPAPAPPSPLGDDRAASHPTIGFFSPHPEYAASAEPERHVVEFKELVRALHGSDIEVILDIAFDRTAEHGPDDRVLSLRGFDPRYYRRGTDVLDVHWPPVTRLMLDALRYWAEEMHVDGFRLRRMQTVLLGPDGRPGGKDAPILDLIRQEPELRGLKLIAEPNGLGPTVSDAGVVPEGWAEMNLRAPDTVSSYWANRAPASQLASVLAGSEERYHPRFGRTHLPVNSLRARVGPLLRDLSPPVIDVRQSVSQNMGDVVGMTAGASAGEYSLLASVLVARGVPMLRAGDELGQTPVGGASAGGRVDEALRWEDQPWTAAIRRLIDLRRRYPALAAPPGAGQLQWLGAGGAPVERQELDDLAAFAVLVTQAPESELLICFNPEARPVAFTLPDRPGWRWTEAANEPVEGTVSVEQGDTRVLEGAPAPAPPRRPTELAGDVVIVIPGFGGSTLARDGRELWGTGLATLLRTFRTLGSALADLALEGDDPDVEELGDGVEPTGLMPAQSLAGVSGYSKLIDRLESQAPGRLLTVPWDWRRDLRAGARRLAGVAEEALARQRSGGDPEAKLVLVAHGIGGLVASWFTDVLGGHEVSRALVTLGTPFSGTVSGLDRLSHGWRPAGRLGPDLTTFLRSLTSSYQSLATYPCIDVGDGQLRRVTEVVVPDLDPARVAAGQDFLAQLAAAGAARAETSIMRQRCVAGVNQPTPLSARLEADRLELLYTYRGEEGGGGDGTVPSVSAQPRWGDAAATVYVEARNADLPASDEVLTLLRSVLTESRRELYQ